MTEPHSEPTVEASEELWRDDELSDEAIDLAAGQGGKLSVPTPPPLPCLRGRSS